VRCYQVIGSPPPPAHADRGVRVRGLQEMGREVRREREREEDGYEGGITNIVTCLNDGGRY
jgi:hypothetical protein